MYIEIDHKLLARHINDINKKEDLPGRKKVTISGSEDKFALFKEYELKNQNIGRILHKFEKIKKAEALKKQDELEWVIGSNEEVWHDLDWGFFSAILACYNNHWVLKTSPDDWWNVVVRNVAQIIDEKGELANIRSFFVDHQGKKPITIATNATLDRTDFSWLFTQFSDEIRKNVKTPGFVDLMQADFSTTTPQQLVTTQIMMMASMQKFFNYRWVSRCGIPGVEMLGTSQDWEKLIVKLHKLEALLQPIMGDLGLENWFLKSKILFGNLLDTYHGDVDKDWWGYILSWDVRHGSGQESTWSGWIADFFMYGGYKDTDFRSGVVAVPLKIRDNIGIPVEDTGVLVAGTVGFTVEDGSRGPTVSAKQGWCLLMPKDSPVTPRLRAGQTDEYIIE